MTNLDIINRLRSSVYKDADGEDYTLSFEPRLTESELDALAGAFPTGTIPAELLEILRETKGWSELFIERVYFDAIYEFGFEDLIPHSVSLGTDGAGNYWVLDISRTGELGKVFYACHDPAVLVIFSSNLHEFLLHMEDYHLNTEKSYLNEVYEKVVGDIWRTHPNVVGIADFRQQNPSLTPFLQQYADDEWEVADLRQANNREGFAWGKLSDNKIINRHPTELVWVIEKKKQKGWLSKLFR